MVPPAHTAGSIVTFYSTGYLKPHVDGTHGPAGLRNTQRYGLPDPPRLSAIGLRRRIGIAIRDNSFSVDLQRISGILQDFATSLTVGETFPRRFALVLCSPATAYKHVKESEVRVMRALAAQFTISKANDQPADRARGLSWLTAAHPS